MYIKRKSKPMVYDSAFFDDIIFLMFFVKTSAKNDNDKNECVKPKENDP